MTEQERPSFIAQEINNLIIVRMGGVINAETFPESQFLIDELIEKHEIYKRQNLRILVDYQNVTDVDTSTVANILDRINEHEKHNHIIAFVNVPEELKSLVEIYKLEKEVLIFESEEEAVKALTQNSQ